MLDESDSKRNLSIANVWALLIGSKLPNTSSVRKRFFMFTDEPTKIVVVAVILHHMDPDK